MNLPSSGLTSAQLNSLRAKLARVGGQCVGVTVGCLMGMTCLLFIDTDRAEREKKVSELNLLFDLVERSSLEAIEKLIGAELAVLWIYDDEEDELMARVMSREAPKDLDEMLDWSTSRVQGVIESCKTLRVRQGSGHGPVHNSVVVPVVGATGEGVE